MNGHSRHMIRWLCIVSLCTTLIACADNPSADLEEYVRITKSQQKSSIDPLPEFQPYESFTYQANDLRDPFTKPTFSHAKAVSNVASNNGIKPDFDRPTEPLEEFTLDSLRMVGTLEQHDEQWALINDTDGTIHRVQPGNYAGQNHGKITLEFRELVITFRIGIRPTFRVVPLPVLPVKCFHRNAFNSRWLQAIGVDADAIGVGAGMVKGLDTANAAEQMFGCSRVEGVFLELIAAG